MSLFAKRHYQAIATQFQASHPGPLGEANRAVIQWNATVREFSEMFHKDNDKFNVGLFEQACQPGSNVRARKVA